MTRGGAGGGGGGGMGRAQCVVLAIESSDSVRAEVIDCAHAKGKREWQEEEVKEIKEKRKRRKREEENI